MGSQPLPSNNGILPLLLEKVNEVQGVLVFFSQ